MSSGDSKPSRQSDVRRTNYAGQHTMSIAVNLDVLDAMIAGLDADVQAAARPAAQAAAQVIYEAVGANVAALGSKTGNLANAIYQAYSQDNSGPGKATYHISWNAKRAPHGHLVEFGHIQRYAVHLGADGLWHTLVRPSMRGKPKPKRGASQAEKDAYYVPRAGGPVQIAAHPFVRPAIYKAGQAQAAAAAKFYEVVGAK